MMGLADVAALGGIEARGGRSWGPCPVCHAERRGRGERRGPLAFYGDHWKCHAANCSAGGTALALLAAVRLGEIPPHGDPRWRAVYEEAGAGHTPSQPRVYARPLARFVSPRPPESPRNGSHAGGAEGPGPTYPPLDEVQSLWDACARLDGLSAADAAVQCVVGRGLLPRLLAQLDVARALPEGWAGRRPRWLPRTATTIHRLVLPVHDARGALRSLRFRAVAPQRIKSLPPTGFRLSGLVMADPLALALLRGQRADEEGLPWDGRVVVCEGETDFWTLAARPTRFDRVQVERRTFAVFGIVSGSWTPDIAARIPDGARVLIATDLDEAGDRYAETVRASLAARCTVLRRPLPPPSPPARS